MDLFRSFFNIDEEFERFFANDGPLVIVDDILQQFEGYPQGQNVSPRELMLKKSYLRSRQYRQHKPRHQEPLPGIDSFFKNFNDDSRRPSRFHSESFVQTFSTGPDGKIKEKIVIRDSDGNEKIITRSSGGDDQAPGQVIQTEINKVDGQVVGRTEIASDIGDDLSNINLDNKNPQPRERSKWSIPDWFRLR